MLKTPRPLIYLQFSMEYLEKECPADWSSDEAAIEDNLSKMRGKWKEVWGAMGEKEYGLGGA